MVYNLYIVIKDSVLVRARTMTNVTMKSDMHVSYFIA